MKKKKLAILAGMMALVIAFIGCSSGDDEVTPQTPDEKTDEDILTIYEKIYSASEVYIDGEYIVVKTNGVPDHNSPYFQGTEWESQYEAYDDPLFRQNPNKISSHSYTFRFPKNPQEATSKSATPLGAIGVSLNGVPFFNQYAGPNQPLTSEISSFDQYRGHPTGGGHYHYHVEPVSLTSQFGKTALIGFLLDGFPVYGPTENGKTVTNAELDEYHGHSHETTEYPEGIYHYHITSTDPYINGNGFFGIPGTVSE